MLWLSHCSTPSGYRHRSNFCISSALELRVESRLEQELILPQVQVQDLALDLDLQLTWNSSIIISFFNPTTWVTPTFPSAPTFPVADTVSATLYTIPLFPFTSKQSSLSPTNAFTTVFQTSTAISNHFSIPPQRHTPPGHVDSPRTDLVFVRGRQRGQQTHGRWSMM